MKILRILVILGLAMSLSACHSAAVVQGTAYFYPVQYSYTDPAGKPVFESQYTLVMAQDSKMSLTKGTIVIINTELMSSEMKESLRKIPSGELVRFNYDIVMGSDPPQVTPLRIGKTSVRTELTRSEAVELLLERGYVTSQ